MANYDDMAERLYSKAKEQKTVRKNRKKAVMGGAAVALAGVITAGVLLNTLPIYSSKLISSAKEYPKLNSAYELKFEGSGLDGLTTFSGDTFNAVKKEKNTLYSPLGLFMGLAILVSGAQGTTKAELLSLLNMDEGTLYRLASDVADYCHLNDKIIASGSLWIKKDFPVKEEFLSKNTKYFGEDIFRAKFDKSTVADINKWADRATKGQIKKVLEKLDVREVMRIVNALHLEAKWTPQFTQTVEMPFRLFGCDAITVPTLKRDLHAYRDSGNALAFDYRLESNLYFMGILPNEERGYVLDGAELSRLFDGEIYGDGEVSYEVHTSLPTFEYSDKIFLTEPLKTLGVMEMFSNTADFSGISDIPTFVTTVEQDTKIELDKEGIRASAVTQIGNGAMSAPPDGTEITINLDRPFYYVIYSACRVENAPSRYLPLFIGYVNDPSA